MYLDPTWGAGHRLSLVLGAPPLHIAHPDGTHAGQLVDRLKPLVDRLGQEVGKLLVVAEYLEVAPRGDLAHSGRVPAVPHVGVGALDEDATGLAGALGKHLPAHVEETHAPPDVPPGLLDDGVAVNVGEEAQAEALGRAGVRVAVDGEAGLGGVEHIPHPVLHLVVGDRAPVGRLTAGDNLIVCQGGYVYGGRGRKWRVGKYKSKN